MALALDATTPTRVQKAATGNTATTASFTAPANALLLAFWSQDHIDPEPAVPTIADTGGLTWTLVYRLSQTSSPTIAAAEPNTPTPTGTPSAGVIKCWRATTTSAAARTVTVTEVGSTGKEGQLSVKVITDAGSAPTVGAVATAGGSASAPTKAVTTTGANSWVWAGGNDWDAAGAGTAGTSQTIVDTWAGLNGSYHLWRQTATTASSGTAVTMNLTAPASQRWNIGVVEIRAAGAAPALPPIIVLAPRR